MYHVITNLELMFRSLEDALAWAENCPEFSPKIPATAMCGEDLSTPRICGAPKVEDCITALGVTGTFRRCLNADPDAKSYENDGEAYPVLIAEFDDDLNWIEPTASQVPDVSVTHERWLLEPARPMKVELKWLDAYSLCMRDAGLRMACTKAKFLDNTSGYNHPWLDGQGHPLDCPDMGSDPWPDASALAGNIFLDGRLGGHAGFAVPNWPLDGSWLFTPFEPGAAPYRTYAHDLKRFTGYYDADGEPVFEGYAMKWGEDAASRKMGDARLGPASGWRIDPWDGSPPIPFPEGSRVLSGMLVHIGHAFNHEIKIPEQFRDAPASGAVPES